MAFLLLASLFLSNVSLPFLAMAFHRRRARLGEAARWGLWTAGTMTLSLIAYTAYLFAPALAWKALFLRIAILLLNTAGVLSAFLVLALVGRPLGRRFLWGFPYLILLWLAHAPLFTHSLPLQEVNWGGRLWVVLSPGTWPSGGRIRTLMVFFPLVVALGVAVWERWRGVPQHRWSHIGVFIAALLMPYVLWALDFFLFRFPIALPWAGLWVTAGIWLWGLYRVGVGDLAALQVETLLRYAGAGILLYTWPQRRLIWWNRQVEEWFGKGDDGRPDLPDTLEARLPQLFHQTGPQEVHAEETLFRRFEVRCIDVRDGDQVRARALVLYDITESHRVQQMLLQQHTMESRRRRLLEMALNTVTWRELAYRMVQYLSRPWPEFAPMGCALYLCPQQPGGERDVTTGHLVSGMPSSLPWRPVWENIPQATLLPLARVPVVDPEDVGEQAHALGIIPLIPPGEERPLGYLTFLLSQDQIEAWDRWVNVRKDLGLLVAFLLQFAWDREHQILLERVFHRTSTAVLILDREGRPLLWNPAFVEVLRAQGVPPEGLTQRQSQSFLDWWWRTPLWSQVLRSLQEEGYWHRIFPQPGQDEERFWWIAAFPIYDGEGEIHEVGCVVYDFTRLEQARRELQAQQGFLERLLYSARTLWATLPSLNQLLSETLNLLRQWYPQAHVSLVLLEQDAAGRLYATMWMRETGWQAVPPFFHRILQEGAMGWALRHQESLYIPDVREDSRWHPQDLPGVEVRSALVAPMLYRQRPLGVLVLGHEEPGAFREVDQRLVSSLAQWLALALYNARLYEDQLRLQRLYRRERQRMEEEQKAQEQAFEDLSQEMRAPLLTFAEYLTQVREAYHDDRSIQEILETLSHLTQDMLGVLETYLDYRRLRQQSATSTLVPFPVAGLFQEVERILAPLVERYQVRLLFEVHPPDLSLTQNRGVLRQVLQTLTEFGVRRAQGGQVVLRAFYDPESSPPGVVFWVMDTGPPVEPEQVEALFQEEGALRAISALPLAFQSRQIDLAVIQDHVRTLGGRLRIRPVPGFGLAFWLWVPRTALPSATSREGTGSSTT